MRSRRPRSARVARSLTAAASSTTALEKPWRTPLACSRRPQHRLEVFRAAEDLDDPAPVAVRRHGEDEIVHSRRHAALGDEVGADVGEQGLERPELAPAGDAVRERAAAVRSVLRLLRAFCRGGVRRLGIRGPLRVSHCHPDRPGAARGSCELLRAAGDVLQRRLQRVVWLRLGLVRRHDVRRDALLVDVGAVRREVHGRGELEGGAVAQVMMLWTRPLPKVVVPMIVARLWSLRAPVTISEALAEKPLTSTTIGSSISTPSPAGTFAASCPTATIAPPSRSRATVGESARSEPLTVAPSAAPTSASPLIPAPPIPMKWSRRPAQGLASVTAGDPSGHGITTTTPPAPPIRCRTASPPQVDRNGGRSAALLRRLPGPPRRSARPAPARGGDRHCHAGSSR